MIPRRSSRRRSSFIPSPPNIPDIVWTAAADHLSSLSFSLARSFSSGYYETRFQRRRRRTMRRGKEEREEEAMENVGRVPARHCHFHRLAAFPQLFYLLFLVAISFLSRKASGAMKICCSLFETYGRLDVPLVRYIERNMGSCETIIDLTESFNRLLKINIWTYGIIIL